MIRTALPLTILLLAALAPRPAVADRGALTLELGPALTWWPSLPPPVGSGPGVPGTAGGGVVAVRYGLGNHFEVSLSGFYEFPAAYTFSSVSLDVGGSTYPGTLTAKESRWGAMAGARYVLGLVWRFHLGVELGLSHQNLTELDLVNVSDPSNPHSYGLGLPTVGKNAFVVAPLAGIEWQLSDHWSVSLMPRVEFLVGGVGRLAVVVPLTAGYSWYGL